MTTLKKSLSTFQLTLYGIGTIIGAGIYVLIGEVAGVAGTMAPLSFVLSAIIAVFSALSYAALSSRYPKSGGEVVFTLNAFKKTWLARLTGYLVLFTGIVTSATLLKGFSGYLNNIVPMSEPVSMGLLIIVLAGICVLGINLSVGIVGFITIIEIVGLFFVMGLAYSSFGSIEIANVDFFPAPNKKDLTAVFSGAFLAFFAFIGFEDLANVAEEAKNPRHSVPRAVMISMVVCTLLYVSVAIFCVKSTSIEVLSNSKAPLAEIALKHGKKYDVLMSLIGIVALVNGAFVQIIMGSRVIYGMAEKQLFPLFFHTLSERFRTPVRSIVLISIVIYFLAVSFPLVGLAESASFIILIVFSLVNLALFRLSLKHKKNFATYHTVLSCIGLILCLSMLTFRVVSTL